MNRPGIDEGQLDLAARRRTPSPPSWRLACGRPRSARGASRADRLRVWGADFGFPACPAQPAECARFTKPFHLFPPHASPMGLSPMGKKLYVALFGGTGKGPMVISMPTTGGKLTPVLTGFSDSPVALAAHEGVLYVGELTGAIDTVKP